MMGALKNFRKGLTRLLEIALIVVVGILVIDVVWGVFTRYVVGQQANWTEELARFLLVWVAMLGGALAFSTRAHLGVDFVVEKMHPDSRKLMAVVAHLIVLFFAAAVFIKGGGRIAIDALEMDQLSPALGWKMGYVYLALPVGGIFMILFTLEKLVEVLMNPAGYESSNSEQEELI